MVERLRVILAQVNTYLVLAGLLVTIVAGEVTPLLDNDTAAVVSRVVATALAWLAAAGAIIRRSQEVPVSQRGILPPGH